MKRIVGETSLRAMRAMRQNHGKFTIRMRDDKIVDSHPKKVSANTIRAMRRHGYVTKHVDLADNDIIHFRLTEKAYNYLDEIEWNP